MNDVVFVLKDMRNGGVEYVTHNLMSEMVKDGLTVKLFILTNNNSFRDIGGVDICVLSRSNYDNKFNLLLKIPIIVFRLRSKLKNIGDAHVISSKEFSNMIVLVSSCLLKNIKTKIFWRHVSLVGSDCDDAKWYTKYFYKYLYPKCGKIVFVSHEIYQQYIKLVGEKSYKVKSAEVIYTPALFMKDLVGVKENHFENKVKKIVASGRLSKQKGFDVLIDAASMLSERNIQFKLEIYGVGELRSDLNNKIKSSGLSDKVFLMGHECDKKKIYGKADLFVLSSLWEGLPTVLIEAIGYGVSYVATRCATGPAEIYSLHPYGVLCATGDARSLADGIVEVISNAEKYKVPRDADLSIYSAEVSCEQFKKLLV